MRLLPAALSVAVMTLALATPAPRGSDQPRPPRSLGRAFADLILSVLAVGIAGFVPRAGQEQGKWTRSPADPAGGEP